MSAANDEERKLRECIATLERMARDPSVDRSVIAEHRAKLLEDVRRDQQRLRDELDARYHDLHDAQQQIEQEQAKLLAATARLESLSVDLAASGVDVGNPPGSPRKAGPDPQPAVRWTRWVPLIVVGVLAGFILLLVLAMLFVFEMARRPPSVSRGVPHVVLPQTRPPTPPPHEVPYEPPMRYEPTEIEAALAPTLRAARRCSARDMGRVTLDLSVDGRTGVVLGVSITASRLEPQVRSCLAGVVSRAQFPSIGDGRVRIRHEWAVGELPQILSRSGVESGMNAVMPTVNRACDRFADGRTTVMVSLVIDGATGRVSSVEAQGAQADTDAGHCVERVVRRARFSRFVQSSLTVRYPFILAAGQ